MLILEVILGVLFTGFVITLLVYYGISLNHSLEISTPITMVGNNFLIENMNL